MYETYAEEDIVLRGVFEHASEKTKKQRAKKGVTQSRQASKKRKSENAKGQKKKKSTDAPLVWGLFVEHLWFLVCP